MNSNQNPGQLVEKPARVYALYAVMTADPIGPEGTAPLPDEHLLRLRGASSEQITQFRTRPHKHIISGHDTLDNAIDFQYETRAHALSLANDHDGLVIDLQIPTFIARNHASSITASDWIQFDYDHIQSRQITVLGLGAFGLPLTTIRDIEPTQHAMYTALATGLAQRMLDEWPTNDPVGKATITLRDIAFGLGDAQAASTPRTRGVEVDIGYNADDDRLNVTTDEDLGQALFR